MNRKFYWVLGFLGLAVFGLGVSQMWSGVHSRPQDKFIGSAGYELVAGQAALGLALIAAILLFVKPKLAALPGVLILACIAFAFLVPKTDNHTPQLGIYLSAVGAFLIIVSTFFVPIPHPRR